MANGDDALAAGMDILSGTDDRRNGWDEINKSRDYIAQRTSAVTPVAKGGTAATTAAGARANLDVPKTGDVALRNGLGFTKAVAQLTDHNLGLYYNDGAARFVIRKELSGSSSDTVLATEAMIGDKIGSGGGTITGTLNLPNLSAVTSGYVAMYKNGDGRVGITPSAARFKKDIRDHTYTLDDAAAIRIRDYRLRADIYGSADAPVEVGVIAEELLAAGLSEFVAYDQDGEPLSVHYERLALVALGALQDVAKELDLINDRLTALEADHAGN